MIRGGVSGGRGQTPEPGLGSYPAFSATSAAAAQLDAGQNLQHTHTQGPTGQGPAWAAQHGQPTYATKVDSPLLERWKVIPLCSVDFCVRTIAAITAGAICSHLACCRIQL